ncbi:MAG: hypothetical protein ACI4AL_11985 [Aristaeellaceae bacterium]
MKKSRKMALTGMLCALAVVIMMLGGVIPLATFCCPALAGLMLIPVFVECGEKLSWCAYAAIAALSLILCPDKEAALLFAFIGYYPILRWRLDQLRSSLLRVVAKLGVFNLAVIAMYALSILVLQMDQILREYQEMGLALTVACLLVGNVTLLLYDRLIAIMTALYVNRLRGRLMK